MRAMVVRAPGEPLVEETRAVPEPGRGEILIEVSACGVCRTDLHVADGDLTQTRYPVVPGHEVIGRVLALGEGVDGWSVGEKVGVPWLGSACGHCPYCAMQRENLCDTPTFTGCSRDGGFATHLTADAAFCLHLPESIDDISGTPLLCAGLIGYRSYRMAGEGRRLGLYGFGAAAHILAQVAAGDGREVYAFTRPGDARSQAFARSLGAVWAGASNEAPPAELDAAILFAPVGALVPEALKRVRKGGRVVCAGIHMSDIPGFPYADLWGEREILSVANLTREDGHEFFARVARAPVSVHTRTYPLASANAALDDLRQGELDGAAVLVP
ncbi:zinc-dependent alcohol dehydrogenase family protein [Acuticoccus sediminis]|uniref:zinc-dependent alcohol dehydrogenase family protein n=1 Tax=Acuticoccus sediminis TaxID=2184697 RepID=UPI001CFD8E49|nr:zinc-dependent alcohol dehydrogenase family protein [Acuticoccus sediminis]